MDNGLVEAIASGHEARAANLVASALGGRGVIAGGHDR
jgi:hypothetical protein